LTSTDDDKYTPKHYIIPITNDYYKYIMDLTTNGVVITDVISLWSNQKRH